jgi:hypothetical protein
MKDSTIAVLIVVALALVALFSWASYQDGYDQGRCAGLGGAMVHGVCLKNVEVLK